MKPINEMEQIELGAYIQTILRDQKIIVVLSGGASVSFYTDNQYISYDLDLINIYSVVMRKIRKVMKEIGFFEKDRAYTHPETPYFIEFPPGPLFVGADPVQQINEISLSTGLLSIISVTDCVKDRLAGYYHWGDRQCLQQAILVTLKNNVDMSEVERWSKAEGKTSEYLTFDRMLTGNEELY
jgi:hypothetical protein